MFNGGNDELERAWHERAAGPKETLTHLARQLEDARLESKAADLIADDDVSPLRNGHRSRVAADAGDDVLEPVGSGDLSRQAGDAALLDRVDTAGARTTCQQAEDARTGGQIDDDVAGLDDLADGALVRRNAGAVAQVVAMFVDYPGHEAETAGGRDERAGCSNGVKTCDREPPRTTTPPHSTHAWARNAESSRVTPTTRFAGMRAIDRSITSATPCSRQLAANGERAPMAVMALHRSRILAEFTGRGLRGFHMGRGLPGLPTRAAIRTVRPGATARQALATSSAQAAAPSAATRITGTPSSSSCR